MELADRRVAGRAQLAVHLDVLAAHLGDAERLRPERSCSSRQAQKSPPCRTAPQRTLERVAVRVDESREQGRHRAYPVSVTRAQLPNALTIARFAADPRLRRADPHARRRPLVARGDRLRRRRRDRPGRRLPRAPLARRVGVRQVRRPARRPADDRRGGDPALIHAGRLPWLALIIPARDLVDAGRDADRARRAATSSRST